MNYAGVTGEISAGGEINLYRMKHSPLRVSIIGGFYLACHKYILYRINF